MTKVLTNGKLQALVCLDVTFSRRGRTIESVRSFWNGADEAIEYARLRGFSVEIERCDGCSLCNGVIAGDVR